MLAGSEDTSGSPHSETAVADLLNGKVLLGGSGLAEAKGVETEFSRGTGARLAALSDGNTRDDYHHITDKTIRIMLETCNEDCIQECATCLASAGVES